MADHVTATAINHDTAIVVMARYPEPGKTKTRLARRLGNEITAQLYRAFLTDIATTLTAPLLKRMSPYLAYTPPESDYAAFLKELVPELAAQLQCFPQQGADLGERLQAVFQWTAQQQYQRTIVIGSDTPHLSPSIILSAYQALDNADVVLGPACDGGYYLLGMHAPHDVFSGIPMSTEVVSAMTIARAKALDLSVQLLDPLADVDELADLERLAIELAHNIELAPATATFLHEIALPSATSEIL